MKTTRGGGQGERRGAGEGQGKGRGREGSRARDRVSGGQGASGVPRARYFHCQALATHQPADHEQSFDGVERRYQLMRASCVGRYGENRVDKAKAALGYLPSVASLSTARKEIPELLGGPDVTKLDLLAWAPLAETNGPRSSSSSSSSSSPSSPLSLSLSFLLKNLLTRGSGFRCGNSRLFPLQSLGLGINISFPPLTHPFSAEVQHISPSGAMITSDSSFGDSGPWTAPNIPRYRGVTLSTAAISLLCLERRTFIISRDEEDSYGAYEAIRVPPGPHFYLVSPLPHVCIL